MRRILASALILSSALLLGGCVSFAPSIPPGYTGPRAVIRDSALAHSTSKTDFFVVTRVEGHEIANSRIETRAANYGRGFNMDPRLLDHELTAGQPVKLEIEGHTEYAAPILALTNAVYQVKGEVSFTPTEGHIYVVKGTLGEGYSAVWVEDTSNDQVVDKKAEINGSAKLGFWQK